MMKNWVSHGVPYSGPSAWWLIPLIVSELVDPGHFHGIFVGAMSTYNWGELTHLLIKWDEPPSTPSSDLFLDVFFPIRHHHFFSPFPGSKVDGKLGQSVFRPLYFWLVVWNICYFPIYWVSNHPNWRSYFSEGWPNHQSDFYQKDESWGPHIFPLPKTAEDSESAVTCVCFGQERLHRSWPVAVVAELFWNNFGVGDFFGGTWDLRKTWDLKNLGFKKHMGISRKHMGFSMGKNSKKTWFSMGETWDFYGKHRGYLGKTVKHMGWHGDFSNTSQWSI